MFSVYSMFRKIFGTCFLFLYILLLMGGSFPTVDAVSSQDGRICTTAKCKAADTFVTSAQIGSFASRKFCHCGNNRGFLYNCLNFCPFAGTSARIGDSKGCYCGQNCLYFGDCCYDYVFACQFPEIYGIEPSSGPTNGGYTIMVTGANFNHTSDRTSPTSAARGDITVHFNNVQYPVTYIGRTSFSFPVPVGTGKAIPLYANYSVPAVTNRVITIGSSRFTYNETAVDKQSNTVTFDYDAPTIAYTSYNGGFSTPGQVITLTGASLGPSIATLDLFIDGVPYPPPAFPSLSIISMTHDRLVFTIPPGVGNNHAIVVSVDGQESNTLFFDYYDMTITSMSPSTAPTNALVDGKPVILTITGENFGPSGHRVEIGSFSCPVVTGSHTQVTCTVPAGIGVNIVRLFNMGGAVVQKASFSYSPPTITSFSPQQLPTSGGIITVTGENFYVSASITVGSALCSPVTAAGVPIDASTGQTSQHVIAYCRVPPGDGSGYSVKLSASSYSTVAAALFDYEKPSLTSISPNIGPTPGGQLVTITGNNFGLAPQAFINGQRCTAAGTVNHTTIVCRTNAGQGTGFAVTVSVGSEEASNPAVTYSYNAPAISALYPLTSSTAGNVVLTFTGSNFGTSGSVKVGTYTCVPTGTAFNHTHVTCLMPSGLGTNHIAVITVSGQSTTQNNYIFSYAAPSITAVLPPNPATAGGIPITLSGISLGTSGGQVTVISSSNVESSCPVRTQTHSSVTCTLPEGSGVVSIRFTVSGQTTSYTNYAYGNPSVSVVAPLGGNTLGGSVLTISGASFEKTQGSGGVKVADANCPVVSWGHSQIRCTLPPGFGPSNSVVVTTNLGKTASLSYSYGLPSLTGVSGGPIPTNGNGILTIVGNNFWLGSAYTGAGVTTVLGMGKVKANNADCTVTLWNQTHILCKPTSGEGISKPVFLSVAYPGNADTTSNVRQFSYMSPSLTSVTPNNGPTLGGTVVTLLGDNFGSTASLSVLMGAGYCQNLQRDTTDFYTKLYCTTPAGQGDVSIQVSSGGILTAAVAYSYDPPYINTVSPTNGPTQGGNLITISGTSFGTDPSVTIGGATCTIVPNTSAPLEIHSRIVCRVPEGQSKGQHVQVISGLLSSNVVNYDYDSPVLSAIVPSNGPTQGGILVTISGLNFGTNAVAYVGAGACIIQSRSHTAVICSMPDGSGLGNAVRVSVEGEDATNPAVVFNYDAPAVTAVLPQLMPTAGGALITLTGTSLGSSGSVLVGNAECYDDGEGFTHTKIVCTLPAGNGLGNSVTVTVGGQVNDQSTYDYAPPALTSISPAEGSTSGALTITLTGTSFGSDDDTSDATHTVTVGSQPCPVGLGDWTHSQVICTVPAGAGSVDVVISTPTGSSTLAWRYSSPNILNISPQLISTRGNVAITITGSSFDIYRRGSVTGSVTIGGVPCAVTEANWSHDQIICTAPAGIGSNHKLEVSTSIGLLSAKENAISYTSPSVESITIASIYGGNAGQTRGGNFLTIVGSNFGTPAFISQLAVTVGGRVCSGPTLNLSDATTDVLVCSYPAGSGLGHAVMVTLAGVDSNVVYFNYAAPTLLTPAVPYTDNTQGGAVITITGHNIGTVSGTVGDATAAANAAVISIGGTTNICAFQGVTIPTSNADLVETITCMVPAGSGVNRPLIATLTAQVSNQLMFSYNAPVITDVTPKLVGTAEQPMVTLTGNSFSTSGTVNIGTSVCDMNAVGASWTHTQVICRAPKGEGRNNAVRIAIGSTYSNNDHLIDYRAPVITAISPESGSASGGTSVTVTGTDFGLNPALTIDSNSCRITTPVNAAHTEVVCSSPPGSGLDKAVVLTAGGQISNADVKYSYTGPRITNVTPQNGSTAGGNIITITGTSFSSSSVVTVDGSTCAITYVVATGVELRCRVPPGIGLARTVLIQSNGQSSECEAVAPNVCTYSYGLPSITSGLTISNVNTAGGEIITLTGANFGATAGTVTVNSQACSVEIWTHASIECRAPAGIGKTLPVVVTTSVGGTASTTLSYGDPVLSAISSTNGYPSAGSVADSPVITITGRNFGSSLSAVAVNKVDMLAGGAVIGPALFTLTSVTDTRIVGFLAPGVGTTTVRVDIAVGASTLSTTNTLAFTYDSPIVKVVNGCSTNTLTTTLGCPLAGGTTTITVKGINFYSNAVLAPTFSILVEFTDNTDAVCTNPQIATPESSTQNPEGYQFITCTLPAFKAGALTALPVVVRIDIGNQGSLTGAVSYAGPVIRDNSLTLIAGLDDDPYLISIGATPLPITGLPTMADTRIGFMVDNLNSVDGTSPVTVTYGPAADTARYTCTNVAVKYGKNLPGSACDDEECSFVFCTVPGGVGKDHVFVVTETVPLSGTPTTITTAAGHDMFAFLPPVIMPATIMLATNGNLAFTPIDSTGVITGTSNDGQYIQFNVSNIHTNAAYLTVNYGLMVGTPYIAGTADEPIAEAYEEPASFPMECKAINIVVPDQVITCLTSAGSGGPYAFRVTAYNQDSAAGTDQYIYPDSPIVTDVAGCDAAYDATAPGTINCPTRGNVQITITGQRFGGAMNVPNLLVQVGNDACTNIQFVSEFEQNGVAYNRIRCTLPAGAGTQTISVINGAMWSEGQPWVTYHAPVIASVTTGSACTATADPMALVDCERAGGFSVTIQGQYFGPNDADTVAYVLVGSQFCTNVQHDSTQSHEKLTCTMPSGMGKNKAVKVLQSSSSVASTNSAFVSYVSCPAGTFNDGINVACVPCASGTYSSTPDSTMCSPCNPGEFTLVAPGAPVGKTSCSVCPAGTFSLAQAGSCTDCPVGHFAASPGSASCVPCTPGSFADSLATVTCKLCGTGHHQDESGQTSCKECVPGHYQDLQGQATCLSCGVGRFSNVTAAVTCTLCSAGTYATGTGNTVCSPCAAGSAQPSGGQATCLLCDSGRYQSAPGASACVACSAGKFSVKTESAGPTVCTDCPIGTYQASAGQANCVDCLMGTFASTPGNVNCASCEVGKYANAARSTICSECPTGKYADVRGTITCSDCQAGRYQNITGKSNCSQCPVGTYQPLTGKTVCADCAIGTYNNLPGQLSCAQCASGFYSDTPARTVCTACPSGQYSVLVNGDYSSTASCVNCAAGYYNAATGASSCVVCPAGSTSTPGQSECALCSPGKYVSGNMCVDCPMGKYSTVSGALVCDDCAAGKFTNTTGNERCFDCEEGTYQSQVGAHSCVECAAGSYSSLGASACVPCDPGTYAATTKSAACLPCPKGQYQPNTGQMACENCADGSYADAEGYITCTPCAAGKYTNATTQWELCASCEAGTYSGSSASSCIACAPGTYSMAESSDSCKNCGIGKFSSIYRATTCEACTAGTYQEFEGATGCANCFGGYYSEVDGADSCSRCPIGTSGGQDDVPTTSCTVCAPGRYANEEASTTCAECATGYYAEGTGNIECSACNPGKFASETGMEFCSDCVEGKYQGLGAQSACFDCGTGSATPFLGQIACAPCVAGTFAPVEGLTDCELCPLGSFSSGSGNSICSDCQPGTYQDAVGQTSCANCDAGRFSASTARTTCDQCASGYYQTNIGQSTCEACAPGYMAAGMGSVVCDPCSPGSFSDANASTSCTPCPPGTANKLPNQSTCSDCPAGYYADSTGLLECIGCSPGAFSNVTRAEQCTKCVSGTYQGSSAATVCHDCSPGFYATVEGSLSCSLCETGKATDMAAAATCDACTPGTFSDSQGRIVCADCPMGRYASSTGSFECLLCTPGTFANTTGLEACTECPVGTYETNTGSVQCTECEAGKYIDVTGSASCTNCPLGTYAEVSGLSACTNCPTGKYSAADGRSCLDCPLGKYAANERSISCTDCPLGYYADETGLSACKPCAAGNYQNYGGQTACLPCAPGTATSNVASITCDACPSGQFAPDPGMDTCRRCAAGRYSTRTATSLVGPTECYNCLAGTAQASEGQATCTRCGVGYYSATSSATACSLCDPGKYTNTAGRTVCSDCPVGYYASNPGSALCNACAAGRYQNLVGQSACLSCFAGSYQSKSGQTFCEQCQEGFYSANSGQAVCDICVPGTIGPYIEGKETEIVDGVPTEVEVVRNTSLCISCQPGTYQEASGGTVCKDCPPGMYSSDTGSAMCGICPVGKFSLGSSAECTNCEAGSYQDLSGSTSCNLCDYGKYMPSEGQASCEACPTGRFNNARGSSVCHECAAGMSNPLTGQLQCTYCTPGRFALPGQGECMQCADGTATANSGSKECVPCGDRAISSQDRQQCLCKPGYYLPTYKPGSNIWDCQVCPTGADCSSAGTTWETLLALPGYWRPTNTSMTFMRCSVAEQCTGGAAASATFAEDGSSGSGCAMYRTGIACTSCVDGYRPSGTTCIACPDGAVQWAMIFVLLFVVVVVVWISVYVILKSGDRLLREEGNTDEDAAADAEAETEAADEAENSMGPMPSAPAPPLGPDVEMVGLAEEWSADDFEEESASEDDVNQAAARRQQEQDLLALANAIGPKTPPSNFTYKFKIFISFLQISYSLVTDLDFRWPTTYQTTMSYIGISSLDFLLENITGADCFSQENYYFMYLFLVIAPIVVVFLIFLFWVMPRELNLCCWRNYSKEAKARNSLQTWRLVLYFLFLVFPICSSAVLRHYICDNVDGTSFLAEDYRVKCFTSLWNTISYLSATFILLYPVGIPVFFFVMLRKNRHRLNDVRTRAKLGFLYGGYKEDRWWWEIVDSLHKLFLVAIIAFFPYSVQLAVGLVVAILYLIALLLFNPYADPTDDIMHQFAQVEIFLLILAGYLFEELRDQQLSDLEDYGLSVILLGITFGIVLLFVVFAFFAARASIKALLEKRRRKKDMAKRLEAKNALVEQDVDPKLEEEDMRQEEAEVEQPPAPLPASAAPEPSMSLNSSDISADDSSEESSQSSTETDDESYRS